MIIISGKQDYSLWCTYTIRTPNGRQAVHVEAAMVHLIQHTKPKVAQAIRPAIQIKPGSEPDKSSTASDAELDDIDREIHAVIKELFRKEKLYDADADSSSYCLVNPLFIPLILFQHSYLTYALMVMMSNPGSETGSSEHEPTPCMEDTLVDLNTTVDLGGPERLICRISRRSD
ncbi:hypothetical protein BDV41DRAFT_541322 [Aspergillus transmontanensis]|uniref:Uncharacterized protein n=1 Tax=Aspergillus transmontanensis TaxID=1034304 RepID=A0A5N6VXE9_9EURO|nr:hypothetical protein BDV41DRAFT_541322 [Aspergillus transmontanensis]